MKLDNIALPALPKQKSQVELVASDMTCLVWWYKERALALTNECHLR